MPLRAPLWKTRTRSTHLTYRNWRVSVVMPAFNEEPFITSAVQDFRAQPHVDEVIVVDNNSTDRTRALALEAGAVVVSEPLQGYGAACRRGLASATGDLIFLVEPD